MYRGSGPFWELRKLIGYRSAPAPDVDAVLSAIRLLNERESAAESPDTDEPIFILATGWRTGSTMLQRILVSDPDVLIWGEPFGRMGLIPKLTESLSAVAPAWAGDEFWFKGGTDASELSTRWIANLFPAPEHFRAAARSFFDRWLKEPAQRQGRRRWGFKETRLGSAEAVMLSWLYPRAKFVVLTRNPLDAYRSIVHSSRSFQLWERWPERPVDSAAAFAGHWNRLVMSWTEKALSVDKFLVKYEDIAQRALDFRALESWLGLHVKEEIALETRIGASAGPEPLGWYERLAVTQTARPGMRLLGYS